MTQNKMKVIGLTGSMGSGKSTVSKILEDQGIAIVDADAIAKDVVDKSTITFGFIVQLFGKEVISNDGQLNRKALADIVFSDADKLKELEAITHPAILSEIIRGMVKFRAEGEDLVVLDIPLLFENDYDVLCDETWVVTVSPDIRIERIKIRDGLTVKQINARLSEQMSQDKKIARADVVINNDGNLEQLKAKVFEQIKER